MAGKVKNTGGYVRSDADDDDYWAAGKGGCFAACSDCAGEIACNGKCLLRPSPEPNEPISETGTDRRRAVLDTVSACVLRDRASTYGDAEDNFTDIAAIASVVLRGKLLEPLTASDVALFSCCIKMARLRNQEHLDNWVDLAGYAVCGAGIIKSEQP